MSTKNLLPLWRAALMLLTLALAAVPVSAQNAAPPYMSYQGYLTDGSGNPLGSTNTGPKAYSVVFSLCSAPSGGVTYYTELQTVTVDKGYFSVLLGQGTPYSTNSMPLLNSVFATNPAPIYIQTTVLGIGTGGNAITLMPRMQLVSSPYAFAATYAANANNLVTSAGTPLVTGSGNVVNVPVSLSAGPTTVNGAAAVTGNLTAGSATVTGSLTAGSATVTGSLTTGPTTVTGTATVSGNLSASSETVTNQLAAGSATVKSAVTASSATVTNQLTVGGKVVINSAIGIGTTNPLAPLHVVASAINDQVLLQGVDSSLNVLTNPWAIYQNPSSDLLFGYPGVYGYISHANAQFNSVSDVRLKKEIASLTNVLDRVLKLRPVVYRFKTDSDGSPKQIGFIAQEVETQFPQFVSETGGYKGLAYAQMVAVAIGAIQELDQTVCRQSAELADKTARLDRVERELADLKKQVAMESRRRDDRLAALEKAVREQESARAGQPVLAHSGN